METMVAALVYLGICGLWIVIWALVDGLANAWKRRHPYEPVLPIGPEWD